MAAGKGAEGVDPVLGEAVGILGVLGVLGVSATRWVCPGVEGRVSP